jgi:antitoxin (DNA-binding transcriptional repressor) of toxin-antitoxin stability system
VETFNIHEAKAQFSRILRQIEKGEEVLIARDGTVIARIIPERRPLRFGVGRDAGRAKVHANFDEPLEEFVEYL